MATIIAGVFGNITEANKLVAALQAEEITPSNISVFHLNAAGQHAAFPIGGDEDADPGAKNAHMDATKGAATGAAAGALTVGIITAAAAGPVGVAAAAMVGAYTGALGGALSGMGQSQRSRRAGVMVAINVDSTPEQIAVNLLKRHGALDVEKAEGEWRDGQWIGFDPVQPPNFLEKPDGKPSAAEDGKSRA